MNVEKKERDAEMAMGFNVGFREGIKRRDILAFIPWPTSSGMIFGGKRREMDKVQKAQRQNST